MRGLAKASPEAVGAALGWRPDRTLCFRARARAVLEGRPIQYGELSIPRDARVFFDVETDPYGGNRYVWLIGCLDEAAGEFVRFFAKRPRDERAMLRDFYLVPLVSSQSESAVLLRIEL
jgi:predicted RecB family nuclease